MNLYQHTCSTSGAWRWAGIDTHRAPCKHPRDLSRPRHSLNPPVPLESEQTAAQHNGTVQSSHQKHGANRHHEHVVQPGDAADTAGQAWGPIRKAVYSAMQRLRLLAIAHFLSHSLRSALASAVCLTGAAILCGHDITAQALLQPSTLHAGAGSMMLAGSLLLSGVPAFVDATLQVRALHLSCACRSCAPWHR